MHDYLIYLVLPSSDFVYQAIGANRKDCQQLKAYGERMKTIIKEASTNCDPAGSPPTPVPKEILDKMNALTTCVAPLLMEAPQ